MPLREYLFRNGTRVTVGPCWCVTQLPSGEIIHAHPDGTDEQAETARRLGFPDVCSLTRAHDLTHSWLADAIGLPASISLSQAAGLPVDAELAGIEEEAVLAVSRLIQRSGAPFPASPLKGKRQ